MNTNVEKLVKSAKTVPDPRRQWGHLLHQLSDILVISFCAIICGAQTYHDIELFGQAKELWLSNYLSLPNGIPNADTFERIFEMLDSKIVAKRMRWLLQSQEVAGKIIAFDGKTARGSAKGDRRAFHTLSAFLVEIEKGHGRIEKREYVLETQIDWLYGRERWAGIKAIGAVKSTVTAKGKTTSETRYFITSLTSIDDFSRAVRAHWGIENCLHWHLDVTFGEDSSRIRNKNAIAVWNVLRKLALEHLKTVPCGNASIKSRRKLAGWDDSFLERVLFAVK